MKRGDNSGATARVPGSNGMPRRNIKLDLRARLAARAAGLAGWLSRRTGRGSGGMIGGEVARRIDPQILRKLARGRQVVLVTGTNGKSTTTAMVRAGLAATGQAVASNIRGDNMVEGVLVALLDAPNAPYAALEVDELHLGTVADATKPAAIVLLNLSRDQLDRVGEIAKVERHFRQTLARHPQAWVIANADDPLIASAAWDCSRVIWVSAGCAWMHDSVSFPRTGGRVLRRGDDWYVTDSDLYRRPTPDWTVNGDDLLAPTPSLDKESGEQGGRGPAEISEREQRRYHLDLCLPGRANRGNAAQAVAAAAALGVDTAAAVKALRDVQQVAGRYAQVEVEGAIARLLLAKNPAGWQEAMTMVDHSADAIVLAVNGQVADGQDLSWLWDVDFGALASYTGQVRATGERGADLAVRLLYAGIDCQVFDTPWQAVKAGANQRVDVLANYTALRDFTALLRRRGLMEA